MECPFAWGCWKAAEMGNLIRNVAEISESFTDLFFSTFYHNEIKVREQFAMLLW